MLAQPSLAGTRDAVQVAAERTLGKYARARVEPVYHVVDRTQYLIVMENGRRGKSELECAFICDTLEEAEGISKAWLEKHGTLRRIAA